MQRPLRDRRLRTPREHGEALFDPPLDSVAEVLVENSRRRQRDDGELNGRSLRSLADDARRELVRASLHYTRAYRDVAASETDAGRILLAGHQPELFHPGVWVKNFALDALARRRQALAVNLLIDSDELKAPSIRVPTGAPSRPRMTAVAFDEPAEPMPFELRGVAHPACFESFGRRVESAIQSIVPDPLIGRLWPRAVERLAATRNLGAALAQSRHQLEERWGLQTCELPQSWVCQFESFHWFAAHLFAALPRFWEVHNASLAEYRAAHRLRSRSHPVPDLAEADGWLEAPFWVYGEQEPARRRVFARRRGERIEVTDRSGWTMELDLNEDAEADAAAEQLAMLAKRGVLLRTRALATTMFARLFLGDLFLHGIGGAKYDELTDRIIGEFFGVEPPAYMTATATVRLPVSLPSVREEDEQRLRWQRRDMRYHPERYLDASGVHDPEIRRQAQAIVESKHRWVETQKTEQNAARRHREISAANRSLQPFLVRARDDLERRYQDVHQQLRRRAILSSRDYSFCLHPEEPLGRLLLDLVAIQS